MSKLSSRIKGAAEGLMGNESLLEMLEGNAASELLAWGIELATAIVKGTSHLGEEEAQASISPRLRAVRRLMRSIGNWASGQSRDETARAELRDSLLEQFALVLGGKGALPSAEVLDGILQQAESGAADARTRIANLRSIFENSPRRAPHDQV